MRVLGVDPGSSITGYGIVDEADGRLTAVTWGGIRTSNRYPFPQRLKTIHDSLVEIIKRYSPDAAAIENLFFAENAKSALKLGQVRGAAILAAANSEVEVAEYTPLEIKQAVAGYGRADKGQVQDMVCRILNIAECGMRNAELKANNLKSADQSTGCAPRNPKSKISFDASDALAIAICHIHTSAFKLKTLATPPSPSLLKRGWSGS